jgi:hypothetical protein
MRKYRTAPRGSSFVDVDVDVYVYVYVDVIND